LIKFLPSILIDRPEAITAGPGVLLRKVRFRNFFSEGWGKYGWTNIELDLVNALIFSKALVAAWLNKDDQKYGLSG
jgi:hypothetical protein